MRLIYTETGETVKYGDKVTLRDNEEVEVSFFREPHKPSSSGKVTVDFLGDDTRDPCSMEYYVGVIGAKWIERGEK